MKCCLSETFFFTWTMGISRLSGHAGFPDGLAYFCFSHGAGTELGQPDIPFGGERQEHHGSI